jgi:hypothetical protein
MRKNHFAFNCNSLIWKKKLLYQVALLSITFMFWSIGCKPNEEKEKDNTVLIIPIEDFSIEEFGCTWQWQKIKHDIVLTINTTEELRKFINCEDGLPEIDFSKKTLLLAHGNISGDVFELSKQLKQIGQNYTFELELKKQDHPVITEWSFAVITDKLLSTNFTIVLTETFVDYRDKWCGNYDFTTYFLHASVFGEGGRDTAYYVGFVEKLAYDSLLIKCWESSKWTQWLSWTTDFRYIVHVNDTGKMDADILPGGDFAGELVDHDSIWLYFRYGGLGSFETYETTGRKLK